MKRIIVGWILMFIGVIPLILLVALWLDSLISGANVEVHIGSLITGFVVSGAGFAIKDWGHESRQSKKSRKEIKRERN